MRNQNGINRDVDSLIILSLDVGCIWKCFWTKDKDSALIIRIVYMYVFNQNLQRQLLTNTMINPLSYILLYFSLIRKPENRSVRTRKRILKEFQIIVFHSSCQYGKVSCLVCKTMLAIFWQYLLLFFLHKIDILKGFHLQKRKEYCFRYRHSRWV